MGLGKMLLRSFTKKAARNANRTLESALTAAVVTGVATVATVAVKEMINNKNQATQAAINNSNNANNQAIKARDPYAEAMLGKLALCYYVARADGYISPEEQIEIDTITNEFMTTAKLDEATKSQMINIMHMSTISFPTVEKYLDRVDSSVLISFANDVEKIQNASEGVLPSEKKAVDVFKAYVKAKTGYTFPEVKEEPKVTEVNLICDCCNGTMDLDETYLKAVCPYCGAAKIIDASQISKVVAELEKTKRMNGDR